MNVIITNGVINNEQIHKSFFIVADDSDNFTVFTFIKVTQVYSSQNVT